MSDDVQVSVGSEEAAVKLREDFADLVMRVNMDLTSQRMNVRDPLSVEMAVAQAERSVDYHLTFFADDVPLQTLGPELKLRFRRGIEEQAGK